MLPAVMSQKGLSQTFSQSLPKYYNQEEIKMILSEEVRQEDYKAWFLILFLWNTGTRISEALSVRVEDLDLMGRAVRVRTLKRNNHTRVIPIQNGFVGELSLWINQQRLTRKDPLFTFTRGTAYLKVKKACKLVDLDDDRGHPHTLRHSFAVNCIMHGVPITVLKDWLGHRDITKTLIYTQILATDSRSFMEQVSFN